VVLATKASSFHNTVSDPCSCKVL